MRALWLAGAAVALGVGVWAGLTRLGTGIPPLLPHHPTAHGPLMVGGFLGILVGLELAAALGRRWGYLAPAATIAGVLWMTIRPQPRPAAWLLTAASGLALLTAVELLHRRKDLARGVLTAGLFCWLLGNFQWAVIGSVLIAVPWWMAFAVLAVVGQRLGIASEPAPSRRSAAVLVAGVAMLVGGLFSAYVHHEIGLRVFGAGCVVIAFWGLHHDSELPGSSGKERFTALCVTGAYLWLAVAGAMMGIWGGTLGGLVWDAALHALFLGFVFSMTFGRVASATTVLGLRIPFSSAFYGHLVLLHFSLILRVGGDVLGSPAGRAMGAILNMVAIATFVLSTGRASIRGWLA